MRQSFAPSALRVARVAAGLPVAGLGRLLGVSRQYVQQLESGDRQPAEDLVQRIAELLGVSRDFLHRAFDAGDPSEQPFFRSKTAAGKRMRERAHAELQLFRDLVRRLGETITFPSIRIPVGDSASTDSIERAARSTRIALGLGADAPVANMTRAVERAGIFVTEFGDVDAAIDAFSSREIPSVIVRGRKPSTSRCRFDIAHELGHLVLHERACQGDQDAERQADRFAGALLLPAASFAREFPRTERWIWSSLLRLKARWKVSVQAMIMRAGQLGLINEDRKRSAFIYMSTRGWLRQPEPDEPAPEVPELLASTFREFYRVRGWQPYDLLQRVGWNIEMLRRVVSPEVTAEIESIGDRVTLRLVDSDGP